mmetsp:Transcript_6431/g.26350  ORF Transcript_6431/g.26350 Transcript_6431/m.26350 type:complete len:217 (+) Transcript_6431:1723-2373(+)
MGQLPPKVDHRPALQQIAALKAFRPDRHRPRHQRPVQNQRVGACRHLAEPQSELAGPAIQHLHRQRAGIPGDPARKRPVMHRQTCHPALGSQGLGTCGRLVPAIQIRHRIADPTTTLVRQRLRRLARLRRPATPEQRQHHRHHAQGLPRRQAQHAPPTDLVHPRDARAGQRQQCQPGRRRPVRQGQPPRRQPGQQQQHGQAEAEAEHPGIQPHRPR